MKHKVPVEKGKSYEIAIRTLGTSGEGVGRYEDFTVFVPGALPGESVQAAIDEVKKTYAKGHLLKVLRASRDRVVPACPIYEQCGGCQLQHLDYMAQLKAKRQQVIDAVTRIGGQKDLFVEPTIGAESPWDYRNKMQFPIGRVKGKTVIGCFAQGSHEIIDTHDCHIQKEGNNEIVNAVREIYRYVHFRLTQEAWETYMHREEVKAVRTILNQGRELKRDDIERIKSARRMEIAQGDMQPPKVEPFEFFVIGPEVKEEAQAKTPAKGTEGTAGGDSAAVAQQPTGQAEAIPGGRILLVGHYDPATEQMEMATWEEVSLFLGGGE